MKFKVFVDWISYVAKERSYTAVKYSEPVLGLEEHRKTSNQGVSSVEVGQKHAGSKDHRSNVAPAQESTERRTEYSNKRRNEYGENRRNDVKNRESSSNYDPKLEESADCRESARKNKHK